MVELHPNCRKRLVEVIADGLTSILLHNGSIFSPSAYDLRKADAALPSKLRDELATYVDEAPVQTFVTGRLDLELGQFWRHPKVKSSNLIDLDAYRDPDAVAERLVTELSSLPWQYSLTLRLPNELSAGLSTSEPRTELNDDVRLIRIDQGFRQQFPGLERDTGTELAGCLQIYARGFIGPYGHSVPVWNAIRTLRAFCGLGIGLNLFRARRNVPPRREHAHFLIHKQAPDQSWRLERTLELSEELNRALSKLRMGVTMLRAESRSERIRERLSDICGVFSAQSNAESLLLASQWLFDSYTGHDELLSYVQAMVVLEILLGDKAVSDEIGLRQLLRNRCAYLIASTHDDRTELLHDFDEIYDVRSEIVHRGKPQLAARERSLFDKLHHMCRRVIGKEVKLLNEAQRTQQP